MLTQLTTGVFSPLLKVVTESLRGLSPVITSHNISMLRTCIFAVPLIPIHLSDADSILISTHVYWVLCWLWWWFSLQETVCAKLLLAWGSSVYFNVVLYLCCAVSLCTAIHACLLEASYQCIESWWVFDVTVNTWQTQEGSQCPELDSRFPHLRCDLAHKQAEHGICCMGPEYQAHQGLLLGSMHRAHYLTSTKKICWFVGG